jgi:NADH-quinone oxidoreductase subunit L
MFIVAVIGAATALFAATIGLRQNDIKKVLAYSTISQLGYMFLACGRRRFHRRDLPRHHARVLQSAAVPRFRLGIHGCITSRTCGGWAAQKYMPITFATMVTGWLAISGVPIFAGFFSKDEILWRTWSAPAFSLPSTAFSKLLWAIARSRRC